MEVEAINAAVNNLTKGDSYKEEMALMMKPHANWEQYLVPAPIAIRILGQLMLISTRKDFKLTDEKCTFLRHPTSFRASLIQVSNEGWNAFNSAHDKMNRINLLSGSVPDTLKKAAGILFSGNDMAVKKLLPKEIGYIEKVADDCLAYAEEVEAKFMAVIDVTSELLELCGKKKGEQETEETRAKIKIAQLEERKKHTENQKQMFKQNAEKLKASLDEKEEAFKTAKDNVPSGWSIIGMNTVEGLSKAAINTIGALGSASVTYMSGRMNIAGDVAKLYLTKQGQGVMQNDAQPTSNEAVETSTLDDSEVSLAYAEVAQLQPFVALLVSSYINGDELNMKCEEENRMIKIEESVKSMIESSLKNIKTSTVLDRIKGICKEVIDVCEMLKDQQNKMDVEDAASNKIAIKILRLDGNVKTLEAEASRHNGTSPLQKKPPMQAKSIPASTIPQANSKTAADMACDNARFATECALGELKDTRSKYDEATANLNKHEEKLAQILEEMAGIDIQKVNIDEIKITLLKGIQALSELKEQWSKMVRFFQMMSAIIKHSLNDSLHKFIDYATEEMEATLNGYSLGNFIKDMIYQQTFEAAKIAFLVNMLSRSYVQVSGKYIMDQIAGISKYVAFDNTDNEDPEIKMQIKTKLQDAVDELTKYSKDAQEGILKLVLQNKQEFDESIDKRMNQIKSEMSAVLPHIEPNSAKMKQIEEATVKSKENLPVAKAPPITKIYDEPLIDDYL